jgi:hypothetical protein
MNPRRESGGITFDSPITTDGRRCTFMCILRLIWAGIEPMLIALISIVCRANIVQAARIS